MPYKNPEKQKAYMRQYAELQRKIVKNANQVIRKCQHCQTITIQEEKEDCYFCLKCESVTT
jgi:recombinational DNA repair protein RecR